MILLTESEEVIRLLPERQPLSGEEYAQISGGYAPPTAEQMRNMDCWQMLSAGRFLYKYNFIN